MNMSPSLSHSIEFDIYFLMNQEPFLVFHEEKVEILNFFALSLMDNRP